VSEQDLAKLIVALHNILMVLLHWSTVCRKCDMLSTMVCRKCHMFSTMDLQIRPMGGILNYHVTVPPTHGTCTHQARHSHGILFRKSMVPAHIHQDTPIVLLHKSMVHANVNEDTPMGLLYWSMVCRKCHMFNTMDL
jgi:ribosomal protein L40E